MELPTLDLRGVVLPGKAGEYQRSGHTASLIRELGDNYSRYHDHLAAELGKAGGRPDPTSFKSYDDFLAAMSRAEGLVHAEMTLRRCLGMRKLGKRLDATADMSVPLVDANNRLVSAE